MIVLLCWGQGVALKGNGMVLSVTLFLGEHYSQSLLGGIRFQQERFIEVREHQDRCGLDLSLQDVHDLLGFGGRSTRPIFTSFPNMSYKGHAILANPCRPAYKSRASGIPAQPTHSPGWVGSPSVRCDGLGTQFLTGKMSTSNA